MASSRNALLMALSLALIASTTAFAPSGLMPGLTARSHHLTASRFASPLQLRVPLAKHAVLSQRRSSDAKLALRMADEEWTTATVKSNGEAGEGLKSLMIEVEAAVFKSYTTPGQYVKIRADSSQEKPGFFAMASAPGAGSNAFEFLIKKTDGSAWIADAKEGSKVEMSVAQGKGYKYAEALGDNVGEVLLLATGSGIAPLKAVMESGDLSSKSPKLYYGARNEKQMAFMDKFKDWEAKGVEVIPVLSQPEASWKGKKGYIQEFIKEDMKDGSKSAALICGVNDMVKGAKEVLKEKGVADENVLMNF